MKPEAKWTKLGWRHAVWDLVRYSLSLRGGNLAGWLEDLERHSEMRVGSSAVLPIDAEIVKLFLEYLKQREKDYGEVFGKLRTEEQAVQACKDRKVSVDYVRTKSRDHHQSPKAVVALVNSIVGKVCKKKGIGFDANPQSRCVWCTEKRLHVTARNLDGAIPGLANPVIIWENKEYWGGTGGGSKMSDAVYECNLVGRELREFEEQAKQKVYHIVFVDGLTQWGARKSDLKRFIDLTNQGLIDVLLAGKEIETDLERVLTSLFASPKQ